MSLLLPRVSVDALRRCVRFHSAGRWTPPSGSQVDRIVVRNSLTGHKDPLILQNGKRMSWYICGPTVYDHSHLGHARTYVSFDIIRRVLTNHFGCDIFLVVGMTDVDDKIINKAAETKVPWLELARRFEKEFVRDMNNLNVLPPSAYTRVTEHIPEIIDMTNKLLEKGHAYVSSGSVYFNLPSLRNGKGKLDPSRSLPENTDDFQDEGYSQDKKSPRDFALWKKTAEETPGWNSPWGHGRPGWHIECSAMCGSLFGKYLDMHSGGIDLKFPHHENELFQCEGAFGVDQWVNYFLHSGHLHIEGRKMSKSLKNFITIQDYLKTHTADQWRLLCLLHQYNTTMSFHPDSMELVVGTERKIKEFFQNTTVLRRKESFPASRKWTQHEIELQKQIMDSRQSIHDALCDDFDTPRVLRIIMSLISDVNKYVSSKDGNAQLDIIQDAENLIEKTLTNFGLAEQMFRPLQNQTQSAQDSASLVDAILDFRKQVRTLAKQKDVNGLFQKCDQLRDEVLPSLGYRIEDQKDGTSIWKPMK